MADKIITLEWEDKSLTYTFTRKQVKNINLRIRPDGIIKVSAPHRIKQEQIDEFVRSKYDFIVKSLEELKSREDNRPEPKEDGIYKNNVLIVYLGNKYTIRIEKSVEDNVFIDGNDMVIRTFDTENGAYIKKLVNNWYFNRTAELFRKMNDDVYEMFSAVFKVPKAKIERKPMRSRWGCCYMNQGKIVMNSRLIYYPEMSVKYVFIHEYAHFLEPNHSRSFYRVVGKFMPDYKYWSDMLK